MGFENNAFLNLYGCPLEAQYIILSLSQIDTLIR